MLSWMITVVKEWEEVLTEIHVSEEDALCQENGCWSPMECMIHGVEGGKIEYDKDDKRAGSKGTAETE